MSRRFFNKQVKAGRYAHVIHPKDALSWHSSHLRSLFCSYTFQVDECVYFDMDPDAQSDPKSPWTLKTNKPDMKYLEKKCPPRHNCTLMSNARQIESDGHDYPYYMVDQICQLLSVEKEIKNLKKSSISSVNKIAADISSEVIKQLIGSEVNSSSKRKRKSSLSWI